MVEMLNKSAIKISDFRIKAKMVEIDRVKPTPGEIWVKHYTQPALAVGQERFAQSAHRPVNMDLGLPVRYGIGSGGAVWIPPRPDPSYPILRKWSPRVLSM